MGYTPSFNTVYHNLFKIPIGRVITDKDFVLWYHETVDSLTAYCVNPVLVVARICKIQASFRSLRVFALLKFCKNLFQ